MSTVAGKVLFLGWLNKPWLLQTNQDADTCTATDMFPIVDEWLKSMHGQRASYEYILDGLIVRADPSSDLNVQYAPPDQDNPLLVRPKGRPMPETGGTSFSNLGHYIGDALERVNGRHIVLNAIPGIVLSIRANQDDGVPTVKYCGAGNGARLQHLQPEQVCKPGTAEACCFLTMSAAGWGCEKFSSLGRMLLDRVANKTIRAIRVGNCAIRGREEDAAPGG